MLRLAGMTLAALLVGRAALAQEIVTDVNIVTGLDISYSVDFTLMEIEREGMAKALRDPRVLQAIMAGRHRRVGFAVFAWNHDNFPSLLSWTVIASREDALATSSAIAARQLTGADFEGHKKNTWFLDRFTDLSQAIDHAAQMLAAAPFAADRMVINMVGNGEDNVGEEAGFARDRFVGRGGRINGMVLGVDPVGMEYYRQEVIGGPGAFIVATGDTEDMADAFVRKFVGDIVAGNRAQIFVAEAAAAAAGAKDAAARGGPDHP